MCVGILKRGRSKLAETCAEGIISYDTRSNCLALRIEGCLAVPKCSTAFSLAFEGNDDQCESCPFLYTNTVASGETSLSVGHD